MIKLDIISQEKPIFSQEVDQITAPSVAGEVTILPNHIPLFTKLQDGIITVKIKGELVDFAILGGFMDVGPKSSVTILADAAIRSEEIDEAKAEAAKTAAEETMRSKVDQVEFKLAEASLRKALMELKLATKKRRKN